MKAKTVVDVNPHDTCVDVSPLDIVDVSTDGVVDVSPHGAVDVITALAICNKCFR
jgi:hypothetical protein